MMTIKNLTITITVAQMYLYEALCIYTCCASDVGIKLLVDALHSPLSSLYVLDDALFTRCGCRHACMSLLCCACAMPARVMSCTSCMLHTCRLCITSLHAAAQHGKKRKDCTFGRQFDEAPSIVLG